MPNTVSPSANFCFSFLIAVVFMLSLHWALFGACLRFCVCLGRSKGIYVGVLHYEM
jgi:hypothetical protein